MDPVTVSALIGAGVSLFGNAVNYFSAQRRNQTLDSREDNAIQRRVADLRKAGLNPLLAAGSGAGASSGLNAQVDPTQAGNYMQSYFDLKNQRETYKQNQIYTRLLQNQLTQSNQDLRVSNLQNIALFGTDNNPLFNYSKTGNLLPGVNASIDYNSADWAFNTLSRFEQEYINSLRNDITQGYRQSLFNLKTQGYTNYLNLVDNTLQPLLDVAGLAVPYKFKKLK